LPISTDTGNSGRAKGVASGEGIASCGITGSRSSVIVSAESSFTTTCPDSRDERDQSSTTPSSVTQTPASSAISSRSMVARDDSAPSKPVMVILRPAPDRLSSRKAVR